MPATYLLADQPAVPAGHRGRPAFVHRDRAVMFAELDDAASRFAADVAVFGVPDERWGEAVAAAVVPHTPGLTAAEPA